MIVMKMNVWLTLVLMGLGSSVQSYARTTIDHSTYARAQFDDNSAYSGNSTRSIHHVSERPIEIGFDSNDLSAQIEELHRSLTNTRNHGAVHLHSLGDIESLGQEKSFALKTSYGAFLLGVLSGSLPLDMAEDSIDSFAERTTSIRLNQEELVKTVVLSLEPAESSSPDASMISHQSSQLFNHRFHHQSNQSPEATHEPKHGIIDSIVVNASRPTRGIIFSRPPKSMPCNTSDQQATRYTFNNETNDNFVPIPNDHATFEIFSPGIQRVQLDRPILIDLKSQLIVILSVLDNVVPINVDNIASQSNATYAKINIPQLKGYAKPAMFDSALNGYWMKHEEFTSLNSYQIYIEPIVAQFNLKDVLLVNKNGSPEMILTQGLSNSSLSNQLSPLKSSEISQTGSSLKDGALSKSRFAEYRERVAKMAGK